MIGCAPSPKGDCRAVPDCLTERKTHMKAFLVYISLQAAIIAALVSALVCAGYADGH